MKTSVVGIRAILAFEGFRGVAYLCPAGVPTIGYGTIKGVTRADVGNRTITQLEAERLAVPDFADCENTINRLCKVLPTQGQFDSLCSLIYNIGSGAFAKSTVLRAHNRSDFAAAGRAFGLFNKARNSKGELAVLRGLTIRRAKEAATYLADSPEADAAMPQSVEPESKMTASPINQASFVAGASAVVAAASETAKALADVKEGMAGLGDWLVPVLLLAVLIACFVIVMQRLKQRKNGWA